MFFTILLRGLPFVLHEKQIIYVEGKYHKEVNDYIQRNYKAIRRHFMKYGMEFVYLPRLLEEVLKEPYVRYNAPYAHSVKTNVTFKSDFLLNYMEHPVNREKVPPSLVYIRYESSSMQYRGIELSSETGYKETKNLSNILYAIIEDKRSISRTGNKSEEDDADWLDIDYETLTPVRRDDEDDSFDNDVQQMMEEVRMIIDKLKLRGVSEYVLEQLIHGEEKLSRLHITKDKRVFLPDYDNMEIEMKPLPKTLFLLFLSHPEGIYFKHLIDYKDELMQYYKEIKEGQYSLAESLKSIGRITDPLDNSVNEKCSNVKAAFVRHFSDRLAKNYYIVGGKNNLKKITLPRDLVIWDRA